MLTQARLHELLAYSPETGVFIRKSAPSRPVGWIDERGYRRLEVDGRTYRAHRLAWLYVYGFWPKLLDHVNLCGADNRLANLREATYSENAANRASVTGRPKGVYRRPNGRWGAKIRCQNRMHHLGTHDTIEEAHAAYRQRAVELFGDFARID